MLVVPSKIMGRVWNGDMSLADLSNYLMENYSVKDICMCLAEILADRPDNTPITVTVQEFEKIKALFKIRGQKADGGVETRGRKRKEE